MLRQLSDLVVVVLAAWLSALLIVVIPSVVVLRVVCSVLLLLVLPGYALAAALLPSRFLDIPQRVLFSLGLSLVAIILGGLLLNQLKQPLQLTTWNMVLVAFITIMAFIAAVRRRTVAPLSTAAETLRFRPSWREAALLALALFVTGAALQLARLPTPNPSASGYTMMWMVPATDGTPNVQLGIDSKEFDTTRYNVDVFDNGQLLNSWSDVELEPGDSWQASIALAATPAVTSTIEARLYRSDAPAELYRRVSYIRGE